MSENIIYQISVSDKNPIIKELIIETEKDDGFLIKSDGFKVIKKEELDIFIYGRGVLTHVYSKDRKRCIEVWNAGYENLIRKLTEELKKNIIEED